MIKAIQVFLGSAILVVMLAGCNTHLSVRKAPNSIASGHVYYLPRTEIIIELERELRKCDVSAPNDDLVRALAQSLRSRLDESKASMSDVNDELRSRLKDIGIGSEGEINGLIASLPTDREARPEVPVDIDLEIALRATLAPRFLPDMTQAFVIDYSATKNGMKSTNYTAENYPNGTLKSINASFDDRSAAAAASALRGVLSIAAGVIGFPVTVGLDQGDGAEAETKAFFDKKNRLTALLGLPELCNDTTLSLLKQRKALDQALASSAARRQGLEEAIAARAKTLKARRAAFEQAKKDGITGDALDAYKVAVEAAAAKKSQAEAALKKAKAEVAPKEARRDRIRARLTVTTKAHLNPEEGSNMEIGWGAALGQWFEHEGRKKYCEKRSEPAAIECVGNVPKALFAYTAVYTHSGDSGNVPIDCQDFAKGRNGDAETPCPGIIYRQPATGLLLACAREECLDQHGKMSVLSDDLIASQTITVPQLGVPGFLPLSNGTFQNNNLQASFAENGMLTKVIYSSNARAEAAAGAFEGSAGDVASFLDARREAEKAQRDEAAAELVAETKRVAAQLALERELKKLEDFRAGLPVEEEPAPDPDDAAGSAESGDDDAENGGGQDG